MVLSISSSVTRAAGGAVRQSFERAGNLADAVDGNSAARAADRIAVDDRLQHERVVGVDPVGDLLLARPRIVGRGRDVERRDIAIEPRPIALQRAIVDEPVAHVEIEQPIERRMQRLDVAGRRPPPCVTSAAGQPAPRSARRSPETDTTVPITPKPNHVRLLEQLMAQILQQRA